MFTPPRPMRCMLGCAFMLLCAGTAARAAEPKEATPQDLGGVLTGIDVLVRDDFQALAGRKVGLITNHTGLDRFGRSTIELLHRAPDVTLVTLFSPEHGLKGLLDERVGDTTDELTGLKVYSLYGKTRRPNDEMLAGIDTLVFDIQDIGARFYTYIGTMGMCMEEAGKRGIRFVVLDRPNPITGTRVAGPPNEVDGRFTAYHVIPVQHGMTAGELAKMYQAERKIDVDLQVIKVERWRRDMWLDETLLTWVNPSPNMRNLTQATLYPGVGLIEACNVSVGRGTDAPFELFGAPWIKERPLAKRLNSLNLPGVRFLPYRFTPESSKFKGESCGGVMIVLTDRNAFEPIETGLSIARELKNLFGDKFSFDKVNNLLMNQDVLAKVAASSKSQDYAPLWQDWLKDFMKRRESFLLYE